MPLLILRPAIHLRSGIPRSVDVCAAHGVHAMHSAKSLGTASKTLRDLPQGAAVSSAKAQPKSPFRYLARPRRGNGIHPAGTSFASPGFASRLDVIGPKIPCFG